MRSLALVAALAVASVRVASPAEIRPGDEPEWKRGTRERLQKRVTCHFDETPLAEAISTLQRQTDLAFTLDARAVRESRGRRVEHVVQKDVLAIALRSILEQAGLDYALRRQGILISTRDQVGEAGEIASEPAWMFEIRGKLQRKISFEYVDTPVSEGVQFFQTLTKINMILDPGAIRERGDAPVTLKVTNQPMREAFDRVLEIARLDYALLDEAVFISTCERIVREFEYQAALARAEAGSRGKKEQWWEREIHRILQRKVTFEFIDTLVEEAIQFLQTLTKTTIILDPNADDGREATLISLRVNGMSLSLALRWILRLAGLDYTLKDEAIWISTPENVLAELRRRAKRESEKPGADRERDFRKLLRRKVSFEFVDTPLTEAIQFLQTLAKCNMILDPGAVETRGNTPINLRVTEMPLGLALDWIMRLAGLEYALKDGAIFISTPETIAREREAGLIPGSPTKRSPGTEDVF